MQVFRQEPTIPFMDWLPKFAMLSGLLMVASLVSIATLGLNFGIDFAGGYEIQVKLPSAVNEAKLTEVLQPLQLTGLRLQRYGEVHENEFLVMVREQTTLSQAERQQLRAAFEKLAVAGAGELQDWRLTASGERLQARFSKRVEKQAVRDAIDGVGLQVASLEVGGHEDTSSFTVVFVSVADRVQRALQEGLSLAPAMDVVQRVEFVGPQVGAELRNQGILAVFYALVFILLYIAIRFDFFFAPGAVVALVHDVTITMGVFSLCQLEFNLPIVAAVLALVGYSLNDTIVVYDRIRENVLRLRGRKLRDLITVSLNQTMSRTLLTSATTLLVVGALWVFAGGTIRAFSIALFVGVCVGTYSSVAVAAPVYALLRERNERQRGQGNRPAQKSQSTTLAA